MFFSPHFFFPDSNHGLSHNFICLFNCLLTIQNISLTIFSALPILYALQYWNKIMFLFNFLCTPFFFLIVLQFSQRATHPIPPTLHNMLIADSFHMFFIGGNFLLEKLCFMNVLYKVFSPTPICSSGRLYIFFIGHRWEYNYERKG